MKPLRFKLYYEGYHGDYVHARIYPSLKEMRAAYRAQDRHDRRGRRTLNETTLQNTNAMSCWRRYRWHGTRWAGRRSRHRGQMFFNIHTSGSGTVTHECVHAAAQWIQYDRRGDFRVGHGSHERLAAISGHLVKQYWRRWYEAKAQGRIRLSTAPKAP